MINTILSAAEQIQQHNLSPLELLDQCLEKIGRYETTVRAWVFVEREQARAQARRLTEELSKGQYRGPLHGVPIGIKDIFDVFDWPTAAGSQLWQNSIARADSTVVKRLRQAGAVLVGKTVTTQYASFDPSPTRNPWNPQRTPGGSSSGSAAAVACGMCLGAIGSQTGGSITRPASFCGVAGCKPTYGRVSLTGVVPLAYSMDHPGPMARTIGDLALLLQFMSGPDPLDPVCSPRSVPDYLELLGSQQRPRLGLLRGPFEDLADSSMRTLMENVKRILSDDGAKILPVALPPSFSEVIPRHRTVMAVEAASFHRERLQEHPDDYLPNIRSLLKEGLNCPAPEYARCKEHQKRLYQEMQNCFDGVDALLCPATRGAAPDAATTGDPAFNSPWSYTGLPVVSIPAGFTEDGMPLAIQLVGAPWQEANLFATAALCERAIGLEISEPKLI